MADWIFENIVTAVAALSTLLASIAILGRSRDKGKIETEYILVRKWRELQPGAQLLLVFGLVTLAFGVISVIKYWDDIRQYEFSIYLGVWLFLAMVAGMFVRVLATNHESGAPIFDVNASDLVYPLLFSLVVFYPIWALAADGRGGLFPIHAAFLNGYFWESVVAAARRNHQESPDGQTG